MKTLFMALISGMMFGFGLDLSQMTDRQRVIGFLDITGTWDPTLIFVLAGAVSVTLVAFRFVLKRDAPACEAQFHLPTKQGIDLPLILGSALFGIGWGLSGYCPGPGLASLVHGYGNPLLYVLGLIAGSLLCRQLIRTRAK